MVENKRIRAVRTKKNINRNSYKASIKQKRQAQLHNVNTVDTPSIETNILIRLFYSIVVKSCVVTRNGKENFNLLSVCVCGGNALIYLIFNQTNFLYLKILK